MSSGDRRRKVVSLYCLSPITEDPDCGKYNPYEVYGGSNKQVQSVVYHNAYAELPKRTQSNNNHTNENGTSRRRQEHSSSAPSSPTSLRRVHRPPKPPRMRSYIESTCAPLLSHLSADLSKIGEDREKLSRFNGLEEDGPSDSYISIPTIRAPCHSSLLHLPIVNKNKKVLELTRSVLMEMLDVDSILTKLTEFGVISLSKELELMACRTKQERREMLLDYLQSADDFELDSFLKVIRMYRKHNPLADFLDVHGRIIQTVTDIKETAPRTNERESEVDAYVSDDCAIFQFDISYWDTATFESISIEEAKSLTIPLKEAFDQKARRIVKRRSYYESLTVRDWNAHLMDTCNIIPVVCLDLYNQRLGLRGAEALAVLLEKYGCIRELSLAKNNIEIRGLARLARALAHNHGLAKLDVRLNPFGDSGGDHLARALRVNKSLRILNVTSTGLTGRGIDYIADALAKNNSLTELDVGFNDLGEKTCEQLCEVLRQNVYLKRLRMRHTNFSSQLYTKIFTSLRINSRLCILDISSNQLGDSGAEKLAEMLVSNRTLTELNIEKCDIYTNGAVAIARALKANTTLRSLDMSRNDIADLGVSALGEALKYNKTLETLCLNMCAIRNPGFLSLLCALKMNLAVKTLKLCYNLIGNQDCIDDLDEYYRTLEMVYDKLQLLLTTRDDMKLLLWGNKLEDAALCKNRYGTL